MQKDKKQRKKYASFLYTDIFWQLLSTKKFSINKLGYKLFNNSITVDETRLVFHQFPDRDIQLKTQSSQYDMFFYQLQVTVETVSEMPRNYKTVWRMLRNYVNL